MDYSPLGSSIHGILQVRILDWVVISSSKGSRQPSVEPTTLASATLAVRFFTTAPPEKPIEKGKYIEVDMQSSG